MACHAPFINGSVTVKDSNESRRILLEEQASLPFKLRNFFINFADIYAEIMRQAVLAHIHGCLSRDKLSMNRNIIRGQRAAALHTTGHQRSIT